MLIGVPQAEAPGRGFAGLRRLVAGLVVLRAPATSVARGEAFWIAASLPLFLLWSLWLTWPLAGSLGTTLLGDLSDAWASAWFFDWVAHALPRGDWMFPTKRLGWPGGIGPEGWGYFGNPLALSPVTLAAGAAAAVNLLALANLTLTGWSTALLARVTGASRVASVVVGGLLVAHPWYLRDLLHGSVEQSAWQWLALFMAAMVVAARGKASPAWVLLVGMGAIWFSWYLALMCLGLGALALLVPVTSEGTRRLRLPVLLLWGAAVLVLLLPNSQVPPGRAGFQMAALNPATQERVMGWVDGQRSIATIDEGDLPLIWSVRALFNSFHPDQEHTALLRILIVLAVAGAFLAFPGHRFWVLAGGLALVASLGPFLDLRDASPIRLPWKVAFDNFPEISVLRPFRFLAVALLAGAVLGARAVDAALPVRGLLRPVLLLALVSTGFAEAVVQARDVNWQPYLRSTEVPQGYRWLASDEAQPGALLEWPLFPNVLQNGRYLFYQREHGRSLVNYPFDQPGELLRLARWGRENTLVRLLLEPGGDSSVQPGAEDALKLQRAGISYLVLHRRALVSPQRLDIEHPVLYSSRLPDALERLLGPPRREGELEFFHLNPQPQSASTWVASVPPGDDGADWWQRDLALSGEVHTAPVPADGCTRLTFWYQCDRRPGADAPRVELWSDRRTVTALPLESTGGAWLRVVATFPAVEGGSPRLLVVPDGASALRLARVEVAGPWSFTADRGGPSASR